MINFNVIISPTDQMLLHSKILFKSLKKSKIKDYFVTLTVGPQILDTSELLELKKIQPNLIINNYSFSKYGFDPPYLGGIQRWEKTDNADVIILIDADTLVCGDLSEIVNRCKDEKKIMAVRNIGSPFRFKQTTSLEEWGKIEKIFKIKFNYVEHGGVNISQFDNKHFLIPDKYINYGFVLIPNIYKKEILNCLPDVIKKLESFEKNFWNGEMAFCIALEILKLDFINLEQKYNYPDRIEFFKKTPCNDIRVLHMVKKTIRTKNDLNNIKNNPQNVVEKFIKNQLYNNKILL